MSKQICNFGQMLVWRSHAPSAEKSEGSGDIAIPYQFSWNAISDLVVKLGSLVTNT